MKRDAAARSKASSLAGRDIGEIPAAADPARKQAASKSLRLFCESYFPHKFSLAWSPDHIVVLDRIDEAVRCGGLYAMAMPRGAGKSTLCEVASLWAMLCGYRAFVLLVGASATHAAEMLAGIKTEIETNELLAADWPEVCYPVAQLEGIANRCKGQLYQGDRTRIAWKQTEIVLPTISGSKASGAILRVTGITGRLRGMKHGRPDGTTVRPSLVILDDPQTDESAHSDSQCAKRESVIGGAVLGLAGPGQKITAICPCTVIRRGDLSDSLLDRDRHPNWTGRRFRMLYAMPTRLDLWEEYATRRADELRNDGDGSQATNWYRERRAEMDAGAVVAWPERRNHDELTGLQHAMNWYFADRRAFAAEGQNEPLEEDLGEGQIEKVELADRLSGVPRGTVPLWATRLTAYIDVQKRLLFWLVAAWSDDFSGAIVDYGAWPDQGRDYFTLADAQRTMQRVLPGRGLEAVIMAGLSRVAELVAGRDWPREGGASLRVDRLLVDANWGESTNVVYEWCRTGPLAGQVLPCHGRGIGPAARPWEEYTKKPGETLGTHWLLTATAGKRAVRHMLVDVNWWKSFVRERLRTAVGDKGALTLPGRPGARHRLLVDHLTSEYATPTEGRGRRVDVWQMRPDATENHWWDCLVGCAASASMGGASLLGAQAATPAGGQRGKVKFSEIQKQKQKQTRGG